MPARTKKFISSATVKEGIPVTIDFGLSITGMDKVTTRALPTTEESRINDLYVLVFDMSGKFEDSQILPTKRNKQ